MGNLQQYQQLNQHINDNLLQQSNKIWAGRYVLINDRSHCQIVIKKTIYLKSHKQAKLFLQGLIQQSKPQFYIINPLHAELKRQEGLCAFSQAVNVIHKNLLPTLTHKMNTNNQPPKQNQIWFILSEISHSLQILHKRNHPHLWICLQTIYYNKDDNWFLHDMHYWHGPDYQNLLNQKYKSQSIMSANLKNAINRHQYVNITVAFDQDIYCLGYAVLEMMSGLPSTQIQKNFHYILQKSIKCYSKKLVNIVRLMVEETPQRRLTLQKLRFKLKMQQQQIMKQQMAQFKKIKKSNSNTKQALNCLNNHQKIKVTQNHQNINKLPLLIKNEQKIINKQYQSYYRNIESFPQNNQRNNFHLYFSPPTHRIIQLNSPRVDQFGNSKINFRYNSPRNF